MWLECIAATCFWGFVPLLEKEYAQNVSVVTIGATFAILILIAAPIFMFATRKTWVPELKELLGAKRRMMYIVIGAFLVSLLAWLFYLIAMSKSGNRSYLVVSLTCTYPLITALLLYLVFLEQITVIEFIGIVLIVAGVAVLSYKKVVNTILG